MAAQLQKRLTLYARGLISMVAWLGKARIRQTMAKQVEFFIEGFKGGINDCTVYVGSETLQNRGGAANTLFLHLRSHGGKKVVGAFDIKECTAKCDSREGIEFSIDISSGQKESCQAIIIMSPKKPDFIILVSLHYLPKKDPQISDTVVLSSYRPLWTLHPPPAFPPEYTPFIFPLARGGNALKNARAHFDGSSLIWGNEYTGVNFTGTPPPQLFNASVLEPVHSRHQHALDQIRLCFEAFHGNSRRFRVDLIGVRPFLGDLKIINMSTQQEVFVELKNGLFKIVEDWRSGSAVLQHQRNTTKKEREIFSWKAQWDYLLTADLETRIAYMLPRDKIPAHWWNTLVLNNSVLEMSEGFQEYLIDLSQDVWIVRDIEKILDTTQKNTGLMRAQKEIPVGHSLHEPFEQIEDDLESVDLISGRRWSTSAFRRGFGSNKHGTLRGETYAV